MAAAVRSGEGGSIELSAAGPLQMIRMSGRKGEEVYEHVRHSTDRVVGKWKRPRRIVTF